MLAFLGEKNKLAAETTAGHKGQDPLGRLVQ